MAEPSERGVLVAAVLNLETGTSREELRAFTGWAHDEVRAFTVRAGDEAAGLSLSEDELDLVLAALLFALWVTSDSEADMFIGRSHDELRPLFRTLAARRTGVPEAPPHLLVGLFKLYAVRRDGYLDAADARPAAYLGTRLADVAAALGERRDLLRPLLDAPEAAVRREAAAALGTRGTGPAL